MQGLFLLVRVFRHEVETRPFVVDPDALFFGTGDFRLQAVPITLHGEELPPSPSALLMSVRLSLIEPRCLWWKSAPECHTRDFDHSHLVHVSCVVRDKSGSKKRKQPAFFLSLHSCNVAKEEVAAVVADNENDMCKVDDAPHAVIPSIVEPKVSGIMVGMDQKDSNS